MIIEPAKYGFIRVASCSPELKVADIEFNVNEIAGLIDKACREKVSVIVFPELSVTGYTCGDLFYQESILNSSIDAILYLSEYVRTKNIVAVVGFPLSLNGKLFNCVAILDENGIAGIVPKTFIPGSNQYYEERWFSSAKDIITEAVGIGEFPVPFGTDMIFSHSDSGLMLGIEICEDLWTVNPPSSTLAVGGSNLIANLSSSDEHLGKAEYRRNLIRMQSGRCIAGYCYASSGPGESTTDLVFSGHCIIAENGTILTEGKRFEFDSQLQIVDVDLQKLNHERLINNSFSASKPEMHFRIIPLTFNQQNTKNLLRNISQTPFIPLDITQRNDTCCEIFSIQSTGLAKRIKHIGISNVVIGISGGLDSTLALLVAHQTFNRLGIDTKNIHTISMPGPGTSRQTRENAKTLSTLLKTTFQEIEITESVNLHLHDIGHRLDKHDITYENAQARERTQILMDLANKVNGIVIGTGDLSELALGWSTFNGDHMSMYGINSGVPKTLIQYIISWCADEFYAKQSNVLNSILVTPISPELLPPTKAGKISQRTEEQVGPYKLNDFFLYYFIRTGCSPSKLYLLSRLAFKNVYSDKFILQMLKSFYKRFFENQFKRSTLPDGPKVGTISLSPRGDWRMPSDASYNLWMNEINSLG